MWKKLVGSFGALFVAFVSGLGTMKGCTADPTVVLSREQWDQVSKNFLESKDASQENKDVTENLAEKIEKIEVEVFSQVRSDTAAKEASVAERERKLGEEQRKVGTEKSSLTQREESLKKNEERFKEVVQKVMVLVEDGEEKTLLRMEGIGNVEIARKKRDLENARQRPSVKPDELDRRGLEIMEDEKKLELDLKNRREEFDKIMKKLKALIEN